MSIKLTGLLHCYQPHRDLFEVTYVPLKKRYSGKINQRSLIPNPDGTAAKDWNIDVITPECYSVLANRNVFEKLPFNFGPSLLKDLWINARDVYNKIIDSEKRSVDRYGGHSNALAQASPNHAIVPLTNGDKLKHISWSIDEYEMHYKKMPEGMWLPETAVNKEALLLLAKCGIKYVILDPKQAAEVKPIFSDEYSWQNVDGGNIDPSKAYKIYFEEINKEIAIFFYDKGFSKDVAFADEHKSWMYRNSENFIYRWLNAWGNLKHFAADGETFGHHKKGKADLLAGALHLVDSNPLYWSDSKLTNYGLFLEQNAPIWDIKITDNTAWSCEHGLVRWGEDKTVKKHENGHVWEEKVNCNCGSLGSEWRVQMKAAFDNLANEIDEVFLKHAGKYFKEPLQAVINYGQVVSNAKSFYDFYETSGRQNLSNIEIEKAYKLMEMQKFKLYMFTSCGWFHDYVYRVEPFANFICANTAIELAKNFDRRSKIEDNFLEMLSQDMVQLYNQAKKVKS